AVTQTLVALETTSATPIRLHIAETAAAIATHATAAAEVLNALAADPALPAAVRLRAAKAAVQYRCPGWLDAAAALHQLADNPDTPWYLRHFAANTALGHVPPLKAWATGWLATLGVDPERTTSDRLGAAAAIAPEPAHQDLATSVFREIANNVSYPDGTR